jgi:hypothetical protein
VHIVITFSATGVLSLVFFIFSPFAYSILVPCFQVKSRAENSSILLRGRDNFSCLFIGRVSH